AGDPPDRLAKAPRRSVARGVRSRGTPGRPGLALARRPGGAPLDRAPGHNGPGTATLRDRGGRRTSRFSGRTRNVTRNARRAHGRSRPARAAEFPPRDAGEPLGGEAAP